MKTDRLIAITMYLLNRETVSAAVLAERFEVSKRSIQRDIEALNQAGIPIVSTYGAQGGYEIFPCDEKMLSGIRNRAFNRYAKLYGKPALLERLRINAENGIVCHRPGTLKGNYDLPSTEEGVLRLIRCDTRDP